MTGDARHLDGAQLDVDRLGCQVCIIGAGAAGLSLAIELAGSGIDTLVLESGQWSGSRRSEMLSIGRHGGRLHAPLHEMRKRAVGGTTRAWTGNLARLDAGDLRCGDISWPIDITDLDPFLDRAMRRLGSDLDGSALDVAAAHHRSHPLFDAGPQYHGLDVGVINATPGLSVADRWKQELRRLPHLRIVTDAHAIAIETGGGSTVRGVRCASGRRSWAVDADHVVVATGGIEVPRLLLASAQPGHERGLGNHSDHLGHWYQDHPFSWAGVIESAEPQSVESLLFTAPTERSGSAVSPVIVADRSDLATLGTTRTALLLLEGHDWMAGAAFASDANSEVRRLRRAVANGHAPAQTRRTVTNIVRGIPDLARLQRQRRRSNPRHHVVRAQIEPTPRYDSTISLGSQLDRHGVPVASVDWRLGSAEQRGTQLVLDRLARALESQGLGRLRQGPTAADGWPSNLEQGYHPSGTTRMSAHPDDGVVDPECRVHGFDNLWINSSSVFPTIGWANPTLTVVALGMRLAERLTGTMQPGLSTDTDEQASC